MILMDTSVWVEFFRQNSAYVDEIRALLERQKVITIEPVFSELLYGVRNKKEKELIQSYWMVLPKIEFGTTSMLQAAEFANKQNYQQLGIGLMDAMIIKSVLDGNHVLWTLDKRITSRINKKFLYQ